MTELRQIPVAISGDWQPVAYVGRALWEGLAVAEEPITALALGREARQIHWARSGRAETTTLRIKLAVFPEDGSDSRYDVRMALLIQPPDGQYSSGAASLNASIRLSSTAPFVFSLAHHVTAQPAWFARPWTADDRYDFGALFVATADTRSARNHLWHLRDGVAAPPGFEAALAHGRSGVIEPDGG